MKVDEDNITWGQSWHKKYTGTLLAGQSECIHVICVNECI